MRASQVPMGKRAMMVGKIVRSNEILTHLGDEYYAWQSASSAVETIERKKKSASQLISLLILHVIDDCVVFILYLCV